MQADVSSDEESCESERLEGRRQEVFDAIQAVTRPDVDGNGIRQYMVGARRQRVEMEPDGNCLFRAMTYSELGDQERHAEMRGLVVEWMEEEG